MDIGNETAGAGVPGVPPNHRVYGLSTSEDRAPARGEGHQEWGCGAQVLNRESDLGRNNTHGGGNDLPLYVAATSPETHGGNDDPPSCGCHQPRNYMKIKGPNEFYRVSQC